MSYASLSNFLTFFRHLTLLLILTCKSISISQKKERWLTSTYCLAMIEAMISEIDPLNEGNECTLLSQSCIYCLVVLVLNAIKISLFEKQQNLIAKR